jgi:hypothetical protein
MNINRLTMLCVLLIWLENLVGKVGMIAKPGLDTIFHLRRNLGYAPPIYVRIMTLSLARFFSFLGLTMAAGNNSGLEALAPAPSNRCGVAIPKPG